MKQDREQQKQDREHMDKMGRQIETLNSMMGQKQA